MFDNMSNPRCGKHYSKESWARSDRIIRSNEIILVTKGDLYVNENGIDYHVKANELLVLQSKLRQYGYKKSCDVEHYWFLWYGDLDLLSKFKHHKIKNPNVILFYFQQLIAARTLQKSEEYINHLAKVALMEVWWCLENEQLLASNPVVEKVAAWIQTNCCAGITEAQVAEHYKYNVDYLNRIFKSVFSKTIKQYINENRLARIKELILDRDLPLHVVAKKAGFYDYKSFLKYFKYHEKITPTEFHDLHLHHPID